jgi:hypothetical protein
MNFGHVEVPSSGTAFTAGVNEGVTLSSFGLVKVDTPNYTGEVVDLVFSKQGSDIRTRIFPPNNVTPLAEITDRVTKLKRAETQAEAEIRVARNLNIYFASVVAAFHPASFDAALDDIVDKAKKFFASSQNLSFSGMVGFYINLLKQINPNFSQVQGKLLCYYKGRYLVAPTEYWHNNNKPFFSIKENIVIGANAAGKLNKPEETNTAEASVVTDSFNMF